MKRWAFRVEVVIVSIAAGAVTLVWNGASMLRELF